MSLSIQNVVVACHLTCPLDLQISAPLLSRCFSVDFEPGRFPGLFARARSNNKHVAILFGNGKCILTGFADKRDADEMLADVLPWVVAADRRVDLVSVATSRVVSMIATTSLDVPIDTKKMKAATPPAPMLMEPSSMGKSRVRLSVPIGPLIRVRGKDRQNKLSAMISKTGNVLLAGATDDAQLYAWNERVISFVSQFTIASMEVCEADLVDEMEQLALEAHISDEVDQ